MVKPPENANEVRNEVIWLNEFIKCDNKSLFEERMYRREVRCIGDLETSPGTFMNFVELKRKFTDLRINYLRYLGDYKCDPSDLESKAKESDCRIR